MGTLCTASSSGQLYVLVVGCLHGEAALAGRLLQSPAEQVLLLQQQAEVGQELSRHTQLLS